MNGQPKTTSFRIRRAAERGPTNFGWLDSRHTFSFGHYFDPDQMGFGPLRVINEDRVQPGRGFDTHSHRDMEILSYVLEGALAHRDSIGTGSVIRPGDVQRMSAGSGISHSEFNDSRTEPVHFLQIWIIPERPGGSPGYEQKSFTDAEKRGRLRLVASRDGRDGSIRIAQDVDMYAGLLDGAETATFAPRAGRKIWIQVASGEVSLGDERLGAGDGVAIEGIERLVLHGGRSAEVLLFDLTG